MTFTIYDTKWTRLSWLILLFHVLLNKVTWWHSAGSWAGVENPRQLGALVGKVEEQGSIEPLSTQVFHSFSMYCTAEEFKLQQLSCLECVFQEARSRNCPSLWALTYKLAKHPFCHLYVLKQLWNLPILKGENTQMPPLLYERNNKDFVTIVNISQPFYGIWILSCSAWELLKDFNLEKDILKSVVAARYRK